eukprot:5069193-Pleurochrysis_carterae.AAC.2
MLWTRARVRTTRALAPPPRPLACAASDACRHARTRARPPTHARCARKRFIAAGWCGDRFAPPRVTGHDSASDGLLHRILAQHVRVRRLVQSQINRREAKCRLCSTRADPRSRSPHDARWCTAG